MDLEKFGSYQILEKLAAGGMATVYRSRFEGLEGFTRMCALKVLEPRSEKEDSGRRFVEEARLWGLLHHPNIVAVHELGRQNRQYFIAMELVEGRDLRQMLQIVQTRQLPPAIAFHITSEILKGLDHAHRASDAHGQPLGIVHRDVSPHNILISNVGEVKLTDFGIAKSQFTTEDTTLGLIRGKCAYMSPEQVRGEKLDSRSDLYALGAVLFEMLTGKKAHPGSNDYQILNHILHDKIAFPPDVPETILWILNKALAFNREDRFQSAQNFLTAITEIMQLYDMEISRDEFSLFLIDMTGTQTLQLEGETKKIQQKIQTKTLADFQKTKTHLITPTKTIALTKTINLPVNEASLNTNTPEAECLSPKNISEKFIPPKSAMRLHKQNSYFFVALVILGISITTFFFFKAPPEKKSAPYLSTLPQGITEKTETRQAEIPPAQKLDITALEKSRHPPMEDISLPLIPITNPPTNSVEKTDFATVRINAIPWAYVTLGGKKASTPVVWKVPVGKNRLTFSHPHSRQSASASFTVTKNQLVTCVGNFSKGALAYCK